MRNVPLQRPSPHGQPLFSGLDEPSRSNCESCGVVAEADHRIANHLAMLSGLLRLRAKDVAGQAAEPSRDSVRLMLEGVGLQIDAISRLHRALAAQGVGAPTDLVGHLHEVCAPFSSGVFGPAVLIEDFPPKCLVPADQILPLTQIVAEVLTNAVKHAYQAGQPGGIRVSCRQDDSGVALEVVDSGAGLPSAFDPETDGGLGFRLLRGLCKQLGGRMTFESTPHGLRFKLLAPPAEA